MSRILLTGASGLVGRALVQRLLRDGHALVLLSMSLPPGQHRESVVPLKNKNTRDGFQTHHPPRVCSWDPMEGTLDRSALEGIDAVIHLAGAGIADKRWTPARKQEIIDSRVKSGTLLLQEFQKLGHKPSVFLSASAVGYYGARTDGAIHEESDPPLDDFLGETCRRWEEVSRAFGEWGVRTAAFRIGVVVSPDGGILRKLETPTRLGLGTVRVRESSSCPGSTSPTLWTLFCPSKNRPSSFNAVAPAHHPPICKVPGPSLRRPFSCRRSRRRPASGSRGDAAMHRRQPGECGKCNRPVSGFNPALPDALQNIYA
ncbi:MAG: NAD-dependent epimerase/dehydratase family protein [Bacteroidales bacterium]